MDWTVLYCVVQVVITDIMDNRLAVAASMGATHTYKVAVAEQILGNVDHLVSD